MLSKSILLQFLSSSLLVISAQSFAFSNIEGIENRSVLTFDPEPIEAVYDGTNGIFNRVFAANCTSCHSSTLSGSARNGAPSSVNFDTYEAAKASGSRAALRGSAGTMPPNGINALDTDQRAALLSWETAGFPKSDTDSDNIPPISVAGSDQSVFEGASVSFDGSSSTDNEDDVSALSFKWSQAQGTTATLSSTNSAQTSFTAPEIITPSEVLVFKLDVTDTNEQTNTNTDTNTVSVTVNKKHIALMSQLPSFAAMILDGTSGDITTTDISSFNSGLISKNIIDTDNVLGKVHDVAIETQITVGSQHQGSQADLLIVAFYTPTDGDKLSYMKDSNEAYQLWDGNVSSLVAYRSNVTLSSVYNITIFTGTLPSGQYELHLGYRLSDGTIVFNGIPHTFTVN